MNKVCGWVEVAGIHCYIPCRDVNKINDDMKLNMGLGESLQAYYKERKMVYCPLCGTLIKYKENKMNMEQAIKVNTRNDFLRELVDLMEKHKASFYLEDECEYNATLSLDMYKSDDGEYLSTGFELGTAHGYIDITPETIRKLIK